MPAVTRVGLLASSKQVVMLCLLEFCVVFMLTEFLQFFYQTHRILKFLVQRYNYFFLNWARFLVLFLKLTHIVNITLWL